jgi:riboflavin kinase / FMN adenylyltransferase
VTTLADDVDGCLPPDIDGTVVTVGTFDGVHLGHQQILRRLTERAQQRGLISVLVTFNPHPLEVVRPEAAPPLLTAGAEKLEVLAESQLDYVVQLPFNRALAGYDPAQFVELVLRRRYRMRELLIGHDHGFGRGRAGDVGALQRLGATLGFDVEIVPPVVVDGSPISSTAIRRAIAAGDFAAAAAGLGRPYAVGGRVGRGDQRGRLLGYPTLNIRLESPRKLLPPAGVYAVRAQTAVGAFGGMMNLGPRPTFGDATTSLEAHLFGDPGDAYGSYVRVEFVSRLRDVRRFDGPDALVAQLGRDAEAARIALGDRDAAAP